MEGIGLAALILLGGAILPLPGWVRGAELGAIGGCWRWRSWYGFGVPRIAGLDRSCSAAEDRGHVRRDWIVEKTSRAGRARVRQLDRTMGDISPGAHRDRAPDHAGSFVLRSPGREHLVAPCA